MDQRSGLSWANDKIVGSIYPMHLRSLSLCIATLLFAPTITSAHHVMNTDSHPFMGGLSLPIHGIDHILAMVAVGLWAVSAEVKRRWHLPTSFLGFMVVGMGLGFTKVSFPMVETGVWVSAVAIGLMIAMLGKMPNPFVAILVGVFGVFHGHSCGADLPNAWSPWPYGIGLFICTLVLIGFGFLIGGVLSRVAPTSGIRIAGTCVTSTMLGILITPLLTGGA